MTLDKSSSSRWLKQMIRNKIDLWDVSNRLNMNPSTIQKILDGCPVSRSIARKIEVVFQRQGKSGENDTSRGRGPFEQQDTENG